MISRDLNNLDRNLDLTREHVEFGDTLGDLLEYLWTIRHREHARSTVPFAPLVRLADVGDLAAELESPARARRVAGDLPVLAEQGREVLLDVPGVEVLQLELLSDQLRAELFAAIDDQNAVILAEVEPLPPQQVPQTIAERKPLARSCSAA